MGAACDKVHVVSTSLGSHYLRARPRWKSRVLRRMTPGVPEAADKRHSLRRPQESVRRQLRQPQRLIWEGMARVWHEWRAHRLSNESSSRAQPLRGGCERACPRRQYQACKGWRPKICRKSCAISGWRAAGQRA
eukprot:scaffold82127_cov31-Tisochrysis_lutea.AAC.1